MIRPFLLLTAIVAASVPLVAQSRSAPTPLARLAGEWIFEMEGDGQPQRVTLTARGDSLRGQVYGQNFTASLTGTRLTFAVGDLAFFTCLRSTR